MRYLAFGLMLAGAIVLLANIIPVALVGGELSRSGVVTASLLMFAAYIVALLSGKTIPD